MLCGSHELFLISSWAETAKAEGTAVLNAVFDEWNTKRKGPGLK
jgi:hypothetical protein